LHTQDDFRRALSISILLNQAGLFSRSHRHRTMSDALCVVGRVVAAALVGGLGGKASAAIFFALDGVYEWCAAKPLNYL